MTVSASTGKAGPFIGNGVATSFSFDFKVLAKADLRVVLATVATGAETDLTLDSDYSVTLNADQNADPGGSITYPLSGNPMADTHTLTAISNLEVTQPTDITNGGGFYPNVIENALDRIVMLIRQVTELVSRALKLAVSTPDGVSSDLPVPVANNVLGWNADGTGFKNFAPVDNTLLSAALADSTGASRVGFTKPDGATTTLDQLGSSSGASLSGFLAAGTDAVATTLEKTLQRGLKNIYDFMDEDLRLVAELGISYAEYAAGAYPSDPTAAAALAASLRTKAYTAMTRLNAYFLASKKRVRGSGIWLELGEQNYPFRNSAGSTLLDYYDTGIDCQGDVVLRTVASGADILQFNRIKNFHITGYPMLYPEVTAGSAVGSNGCSVTGGFDNLTLELAPYRCYGVDASDHLDGGKGFTIQSPSAGETVECGSIIADIRARQCGHAVDVDADLVALQSKDMKVGIRMKAVECFRGFVYSAGGATAAIPSDMDTGVVVIGEASNCQQDIYLGRAHGIKVGMTIKSTVAKTDLRLRDDGQEWLPSDTVVAGLTCTYAHNSEVEISGEKRYCDYKARIGGTTAGSSGLTGATDGCRIALNIGGTADIVDVLPVDSGGNTMTNSILYCSPRTTTSINSSLYAEALGNTITVGPSARLGNPRFAGKVSFAFGADGTTETGSIDQDANSVTMFQGAGTGTAGATVAGLYDSSGNFRLGIQNGNGMVIDGATSSEAIGAYISKYAVYQKDGTLIGYIPLYG